MKITKQQLKKIIQEEFERISNDSNDQLLGHNDLEHSQSVVLYIPFSVSENTNMMIDHLCTLYKGVIDNKKSTSNTIYCQFKDESQKHAFLKSLKVKILAIEFK